MKCEVLSKYKNKRSYYGLANYNGIKVFFKKFDDKNEIIREIKGHSLIKDYYNIPNIIDYYNNIVFYEYEEELINNTLYDNLFINNGNIDYYKIILPIKKSLNNIKLLDEDSLENTKFFKKRIYLLNKYINDNSFIDYKFLLDELLENIMKNKKLYSIITQGDPTLTNISANGLYTDFENSGYNSIVGEISIFVIALLTHGAYFYPKYNSEVYKIRPSFKVSTSINKKNIELLELYLNSIKEKLNDEIIKQLNQYLKYYLCFRIITPIDITKMSIKDRNLIFKMLKIFINVNDIDTLIKIIKNWDLSFIKDNL